MSMDPAYNPYTPNTPTFSDDRGAGAGKSPLKGFVKVVCIFFIVLGALGLLHTLQAIIGISMAIFMDSSGEAKAMNGMNLYPGAIVVTILFAFINFVVSVCEIMAGVMGLQQKRLGANLIRSTSAFMLVFKIVETIYGVVVGYMAFGPLKEQMTKQMQSDPNAAKIDMGFFLDIGLVIGLGIAILMGLTMFFFYLFAFLSFSKKETLSQFS